MSKEYYTLIWIILLIIWIISFVNAMLNIKFKFMNGKIAFNIMWGIWALHCLYAMSSIFMDW